MAATATVAASALLIVRVPPRFSISSSFRPCPTANSMRKTQAINPNVAKVLNPFVHKINPQSNKWTIPLNDHSILPTFLSADSEFSPLTGKMAIKYESEMKTLKQLLSETIKVDPLESLNMIDAIQRLGIRHCFKEEIEAILLNQYTMTSYYFDTKNDCLRETALRFRLLRQHGYFISADVFERFMNKECEEFRENMEGLRSLYEASQLCLPEEDSLEKIGNFCYHLLKKRIGKVDDDHLAKYVLNTLANPIHKSWEKLLVQNYLGFEHQLPPTNCNKWIYVFQHMAKLDFNRLQNLYKLEMSQVFGWWKKTGLSEELKFSRDQPLKWYICSLAFLSDPNFSEERVELTKAISFIYLIDDIYDLYGSLEQLRLFTKAVRRWDLSAVKDLPHPMKMCYIKLYETTNQISLNIYQKHGWNPINSFQISWASLCDAFLVEAEWFGCSHFPSSKDYLENGAISSGVHVVLAHIFFLLGQGMNNQTVQLLNSNPGIVSSTASILRLTDDLGTAKDENQEGNDGSYVQYYMKENPDISLDSARQRVIDMISDAWKRLNRESLSPNSFPAAFIQSSQNIARFVPLLYGYDENQNLPNLEELLKYVLYQSVQI